MSRQSRGCLLTVHVTQSTASDAKSLDALTYLALHTVTSHWKPSRLSTSIEYFEHTGQYKLWKSIDLYGTPPLTAIRDGARVPDAM